jgi:RecA-family ATPase
MSWDDPGWKQASRDYHREQGHKASRQSSSNNRDEPPPWEPDGATRGMVGRSLETVAASAIKMRSIRWLWPGRFAIGKLGLIGGLPDKGKGLICCDIIACVTVPRDFPCGEGRPAQGNVIWFTAEDDIGDTVIPRLVAAGANLQRVRIVKMLNEGGKRRMFSLVTDLELLRKKIEEIGNVALIVIDPVSSYVGVGKVNNSMTTDVRGFLAPLTDLATEKQVAIIGVMHFNKKADVTNAMLRIADSLAYVAAARHVYVVVDDTEIEGRRLFVKAKNNLSPDNKALTYMTQDCKVGRDEETHKDIYAPHVVWGSEHIQVTAAEAMQAEADGGQSDYAQKEARKFLVERLSSGAVKYADLLEDAKLNGISERTLRRAKRKLGIQVRKEKKIDGNWLWELPPPAKSWVAD